MIKLGDLLCKLGDPTRQAYFKLPADDEDMREFLEAARKLFVARTDKNAKKFLKMSIDTPDAAFALTKALVAEIDRIKQEAAEPSGEHDRVLYHRLKMAELTEGGLRNARTEAHLRALTVQILDEADRLPSARRSQDGGKGGRKLNQNDLRWAAVQIEQLRQDKPGIRATEIADALSKRAKKEGKTRRTLGAWRAWLYRNNLLPNKDAVDQ
jgi:hypothetical protein